MTSFRLFKVAHFNLEAWINPGHPILFRQRMEETEEIRQNLRANSAADPPPVNHPILPDLPNYQRPQEVPITFPFGIGDHVTNGRLLRFHLQP
jgi:hypothetical protein